MSRRQFLTAAAVSTLRLNGTLLASSAITKPKWSSEIDAIVRNIQLHVFPQQVLSVVDRGPRAEKTFDALPAFQEAIDSISGRGEGRVVVPPDTWRLNGPLRLKSNVWVANSSSVVI
jgi:polygalacturonase